MSLPDSIRYTDVEIATVWAENDERSGNYASIILPFPLRTFPKLEEPAPVLSTGITRAEVIYLDGTSTYLIEHTKVSIGAFFVGAGLRLKVSVPKSALPSDYETKPCILHFVVTAAISVPPVIATIS